jgi:uncharacterized protein YuzE
MRHLDAKEKGEIDYDYQNDILLFKTKDRDYMKSLEFDNIVIDIDKEGFITGMQIFDASKIFRIQKFALKHIKSFEFNSRFENKVISIRLRFTAIMRNKSMINQGQDFMKEATGLTIQDSETLSSVTA